MKTDQVIEKAKAKGYTLRLAVSADAPHVKKVAVEAYPTGWENNDEDCIHYTNLQNNAGTLACMVLEDAANKTIGGYIFFKRHGSDLYISDMAVLPALKGQGLGILLMAYAVAWGKENNLGRVTLYTSKDDKGEAMQKAYRAVGFKRKIFDYTTDDESRDSKSYPMTAPLEIAISGIDGKVV